MEEQSGLLKIQNETEEQSEMADGSAISIGNTDNEGSDTKKPVHVLAKGIRSFHGVGGKPMETLILDFLHPKEIAWLSDLFRTQTQRGQIR